MAGRDRSFHWIEDFHESLNFWFWLHRKGELAEDAVLAHARRTLALEAFEAHKELRDDPRYPDFLRVWREWKLTRTQRQAKVQLESGPTAGKALYDAVAAAAKRPFTVQWVMAPAGALWFIPPDTVIAGADGGDAVAREATLIEAAHLVTGT